MRRIALLVLTACPMPVEKEDTATSETSVSSTVVETATTPTNPTTTTAETDTGDDVDSCAWPDVAICFEYEGYDRTEAWCAEMAELYMLTMTYSEDPCSRADVVGRFAVPAGGDFEAPVTMFFYAPEYDENAAAGACADAGGTPP